MMPRAPALVLLMAVVFPIHLHAAYDPTPFVTGKGNSVSFRPFEDDQGGFYVAWTESDEKKAWRLILHHFDAKGHPQWDAPGIVVSAHLSSGEDWNGLADGQNGVTLFWDEEDGVHAQRFRPDGSRRRPGESVLMSTMTAIQPVAVPDAVGGTLIAWIVQVPGDRSVIMAQRLDQEGNALWGDGLRVSLRASNQTNPRVVYDNLSGMIVAWRDEANHASELRVQRIDFESDRLWSLEGLKITAPVGKSEFPNIAPLGTGAVVLAWTGSVKQTNQIFLQKVGPDPTLKWNPATYASLGATSFNRWNPVLLGDEAGGTWIAWEDFSNQIDYEIRLNHLNGRGLSVWPHGDFAAAPGPGDQGKLAMAGDGKDGVWLAWIDNRLSTIGLYVQNVDAAGSRLQGKSGHRVIDQLSKPSLPQLVTLSPGKALVAWSDRPKRGQWTLSWAIVGDNSASPGASPPSSTGRGNF